MKIRCLFLVFSLCLLALNLKSQSEFSVETVPNPKDLGFGYVSDPNDILKDEEVLFINTLLAELEDSSTSQIAVVLLNSIGLESPKVFATKLFNHWGIGQAGKNNGLLVLTIMDQHRTEFETGYGIEPFLTDAMCYRIGMQELVPHFKKEEYGQGLIAALQEIKIILEKQEVVEEINDHKYYKDNSKTFFDYFIWYLMLAVLLHTGFAIYIVSTLGKKDDFYDKYMSLKKVYGWGWLIPFPIPYLFFYIYLKRKLKFLRDHPRYSKLNGQIMTKLEEVDDDIYLKRGQITEEEIGSIDYDVWITSDESDVLILRYPKYSKYSACPDCDFITYFMAHSRTVRYATRRSTGLKKQDYLCKNCGYQHTKSIIIPKVTSSSGGSSGSSGGGSWGGGSSGGGGGGVSW